VRLKKAKRAPKVIPETYLQRWSTRCKLTAEKVEAICSYVEGGVAQSVAARAHGVADRTWRSWFQKGRDACEKLDAGQDITPEEEIYAELHERVQDAKARSEAYLVDLVMKAAPISWQAAMTKLERSHPERFGRSERLEHSGPNGGPIESAVLQTQATPAEASRLMKLAFSGDIGPSPGSGPGPDDQPPEGSPPGG
jgi:transposase-like protein